jgi:hypothetical protein
MIGSMSRKAPAWIILASVTSIPAAAQPQAPPTAFTLERTVSFTGVLGPATPNLSSNVAAALAAGALELREQLNYNVSTGILTETAFTVAPGSPSPAQLISLPAGSLLSGYQLSVDKVYATATAVQVVGTIYSNPQPSPFGSLAGAPAAFSFGYGTAGSFTNLVEAAANIAVVYSATASGVITFPPVVTPPAPGSTPTVVISPASGNVAQKFFSLDGSKSTDPNGLPLSFAWTESGPTASITGANTATPSVQLVGGSGIYVFTLTVTNSKGISASGSVSLSYVGR